METRKSKNKVIAALAVLVSMFAGLIVTLFTLPKTGAVFAAEKFDPANVSKAYKVAEVADTTSKLYIRNISSTHRFYYKKNTAGSKISFPNSALTAKQFEISYPLLRMRFSSIDKTLVYCSYLCGLKGDEFVIKLALMDTSIYNDLRTAYKNEFGDKDDGYFCLELLSRSLIDDDTYNKIEQFDLSESANVHEIDLGNTYQIFESYDWKTEYEIANEATLEPSMAISLHNLLFVEDPDYVEPDPGIGGETGGSGSQGGGSQGGGSQGGNENPGDNTPGDDNKDDDNKGTETPKFSLDKVSYVCIGVIAVSAAVVILLKRRNKNK